MHLGFDAAFVQKNKGYPRTNRSGHSSTNKTVVQGPSQLADAFVADNSYYLSGNL